MVRLAHCGVPLGAEVLYGCVRIGTEGAVGVSRNANGFIYVQATLYSPYPSVPICTDRHALKWQSELATAAPSPLRPHRKISRASGAPHQLPWSPSGDTNSSPACSHRTTPQGVHKPPAGGAPHQLPWSPSGDTHSSPACSHRTTPQGVHKPRKRRTSQLPRSPSGDTHSSPAYRR